MIRAFRGADVGLSKEYRFRWFVLTESDSAIASRKDFGSEFHRFVMWLRYWCSDFQYLVVEHRQGDRKRRNWHVLTYGSDRLPVKQMREYWLGHYQSTVTGMSEIVDMKKAILYLAGYLTDREKFVRSWCSQGWVFRGWIGLTRAYHVKYGSWPTNGELVTLALMSPACRDGEKEYLLESGYLSRRYLSLPGLSGGPLERPCVGPCLYRRASGK